MAVDVISFAIMRNHIHLLLAIRPEVVANWTDLEVAERRVSVMPNRRWRSRNGIPADAPPTETEVNAILCCPRRVGNARRDLCSLGFFHRLLKEPCARLWNKLDGVTGHFWEGRFKSPRVLDLQALLDVASYIDLNEVRAGLASSVPRSTWVSGSMQWRKLVSLIADAQRSGGADAASDSIANRVALEEWSPVFRCRTVARTPSQAIPVAPAPSRHAASDAVTQVPDAGWSGTALGFPRCEVALAEYLQYVHTVGQRPHPRKPGRIAASRASPLVDAFRAVPRAPSVGGAPPAVDSKQAESGCDGLVFERAVRQALVGTCRTGELGLRLGSALGFALSRGTCYGQEDAVRREAERRRRARLWVGYEFGDGTAA
jgi:hypothetical protein